MTQKQIAYLVPQTAIKRTIEGAVNNIYGVPGVSIRVVRQHRSLQVGSLQFIDYAVPCFELAGLLQLQPAAVAQTVVEELQKQVTETQHMWRYEVVGGYINVQLMTPYLQEVIRAVHNWFTSPAPLNLSQGRDVFLLTGMEPEGPTEGGKLYIEAYKYIDQVYSLLRGEHASLCLLNDFSERMPHYLSKSINSQDPHLVPDMKEHARIHQATRRFFIEPNAPDSGGGLVNQEFTQMRTTMLKTYEKQLDAQKITDYSLVTESSLIDKAHACVNNLDGPMGGGEFIKDDASYAVYYAEKDTVVSLRSAEGLLHNVAYILCMLEKELLHTSSMPHTLIVCAPNSLQQLITSYARQLSEKHKNVPPVIFFDAHVSRADILQLQSAAGSIDDHFQKISGILADVNADLLEGDRAVRQHLVSFVDLPEALSGAIEATQLPRFFDILSESTEVLEQLSQAND